MYEVLSSSRSIRLLELHPGDDTAKIHCSLHDVHLDDAASYHALSYVWGDEANQIDIEIRGQGTFTIRGNLHDAMRRLRGPESSRILWIDAICINQNDIPERDSQVEIMRHIYAQASEVIVWLGEEDEDTGRVVDLLNRVRNLPEDFSFGEDITLPESDTNVGYGPAPALTGEGWMDQEPWDDLNKLFNCDWFYRVWTFQEILNAQKATLLCGSYSIPWDKVTTLMPFIGRSGLLGVMNAMYGSVSLIDNKAQKLKVERLDLLSTLASIRGREATDARDKVFACLGLTKEGVEGKMPIKYDKTVKDVFVEVTRLLIQERGDLDVLSLVDARAEDLPSWVPDWRVQTRFLRFAGKHLDIEKPDNVQNFNASKGKPVVHITANTEELQLSGKHFSTVSSVGVMHKYMDQWGYFTLSYEIDGGLPRGSMLWIKQLERLGLLQKRYPGTQESYLEAFSRTVVADLDDFFQRAPEDFRYAYSRMLDLKGFEYIVDRGFLERSVPPTLQRTYLDYKKNANEVCEHRRFFVTENDRIGLGPVDIKEGDQVCLLLGGEVPYVLREKDGIHQFIGECYVHGIMDGEAMDDELVPISKYGLR